FSLRLPSPRALWLLLRLDRLLFRLDRLLFHSRRLLDDRSLGLNRTATRGATRALFGRRRRRPGAGRGDGAVLRDGRELERDVARALPDPGDAAACARPP